MARTKVPLQVQFPYHVTARCINREWFQIPMSRVWSIMGDQLYFIQAAFGVKVVAFVLMPNHFHLIIRTPGANLDFAMRWFMRETSRSLCREGNRINQTYGGRYFRSILNTDLYFFHAYKYVYRNPVQAGLAANVLDYPYSSLPYLVGQAPLTFGVHDDLVLDSYQETLEWLNCEPPKDHWDAVRKGLRRRAFRLSLQNKQPHPLEEVRL